jgi:phosphoenolpyruvate synthase/pyruvate phosphate dikinase
MRDLEFASIKENDFIFNFQDFSLKDFSDSRQQRELPKRIGGKGTSLAKMTGLGLPVPPGFNLSVELGLLLKEQRITKLPKTIQSKIKQATLEMTNSLGGVFGNQENPLLVSVRSGAYFSMPGMMNTILNIGINDQTITTLAKKIGESAAWECYRIFCLDWLAAQLMLDKDELTQLVKQELGLTKKAATAVDYQAEVSFLKKLAAKNYQIKIPQDPWDQLYSSVQAVYGSYYRPEAEIYRQRLGLPETGYSTAVNVVSMVFGNYSSSKKTVVGSGVAFYHRSSGEDHLHIQFAPNSFGEAIVSGKGQNFSDKLPKKLQQQLQQYMIQLYEFSGQPVDAEFVVENGQLFLLQYRPLRLSSPAQLRILTDKYNQEKKGLSPVEKEKLLRSLIKPEHLSRLRRHFHPEEIALARENRETKNLPRLLFEGKPIGGSVLVGQLATTLDQAQEMLKENKSVVYVAESITSPELILGLSSGDLGAKLAVITKVGSPHSHAANVLNSRGIVGAIGCGEESFEIKPKAIKLDGINVKSGETLAVDGISGEVFEGELATMKHVLDDAEATVIKERQKLGLSMWESAAQALGLQTAVYRLEKELELFLEKQGQGNDWQSPKAQAQEAINLLFPEKSVTKYIIINMLDDDAKEKLVDVIGQGWQEGFDITVRSAFTLSKDGAQLGVNPWFLLKPGDEETLEKFVSGKATDLPDHKYGPLARWKEHEDKDSGVKLTEVLVGYNHPGKLDQDKVDLHAVGAIRMLLGTQPKIEGTLHPGTFHLRTFELHSGDEQGYDPNDEIHFEAFIDPRFEAGIGRVNFSFGRNHLSLGKIDQLIGQLLKLDSFQAKEQLSPAELVVYQQLAKRSGLHDPIGKFELANPENLKEMLLVMINEAELPSSVLKDLVSPDNWLQATELVEEVLYQQLGNLVPGLSVIENWLSKLQEDETEAVGEISAEFQARIPLGTKMNDSENWWSLYGVKGIEELLLLLQKE